MSDPIRSREFSFDVEAELDLVWSALTTSKGVASWYAMSADVDPEPGSEFVVDWGTGATALGIVDEVERPHRFRYVYQPDSGWEGAEEWLLSHEAGVTHVRLIHSLPVADGATWDDTYPDIVRGWALFMSTLRFVVGRVGALGRRSEVRLGSIGDGAWRRVLDVFGLLATPAAGSSIDLAGRRADVLVATDGFSLLVAFDDDVTLLVDVEGEQLYTLSAAYGDERATDGLLDRVVGLAEAACEAAGAPVAV
jgi:uncharacterized protein YndB with AHSA1/START domain